MSDLLEILAPAGDLETLKVAINNGADAVYLGANAFSARASAKNFSLEELRSAVEYAHLFDAKIYLTVNTIIKNEEFDDVVNLVRNACEMGVDAFLVQDVGLARVLKNKFRGINLHASTQMAVHNLQGARILEKLGFSRVVLSREATKKDIIDIKKHTNLEIEYFVQGALCVSFSGNCYFSSLCHSCSGNRGKCKQLCRLPYTAYVGEREAKKGFLLSPSDQCLAKRIDELVEAGVNSFKIEGRLKKPSYVACAVSMFKASIMHKSVDKYIRDMKQIFARGDFNEGRYFDGKNDQIINSDINNHFGRKIGTVKSVRKFKDIFQIEIESWYKICKGDALKFYDGTTETSSMGVGNVEQKGKNFVVYSKSKPIVGENVNLIVENLLEEKYLQKTRKLPCKMKVYAFAGERAKLTVSVGDFEVTVLSDSTVDRANTVSVSDDAIIESLSKLNDSVFVLSECNIKHNEVFIPKSVLNKLRRDSICLLTKKILESRKPKVEFCDSELCHYEVDSKQNYCIVDDAEKMTDKDISYIFAPKTFSQKEIANVVDIAREKGIKLYLDMPNIARHDDMILLKDILSKFDSSDFGLIANNLYVFDFVEQFEIVAGLGLNIINEDSKDFYISLGAKDVIFSIEANKNDVSRNGVVFSYGYPVFMTLVHCPVKMLYGNDCSNCKYSENITYKMSNNYEMTLRRKKIASCYFELVDSTLIDNKTAHGFRKLIDLRGVETKITNSTLGMIDKNI